MGCWDQQACRPQQGGSQSCSASEHRDLGVTHKKICGCWSLVKYKSVTYTRAYKNHLPVAILGSLPVDAVYTALTRCQAPGVSVPEPLSLGILPAVLGERSGCSGRFKKQIKDANTHRPPANTSSYLGSRRTGSHAPAHQVLPLSVRFQVILPHLTTTHSPTPASQATSGLIQGKAPDVFAVLRNF